jgi:signal transduction histidine kinase
LNLPIRTRLTAIYCVVFCLVGAALETGAYFALKLAVDAIADRELSSRLLGVEEFLGDHLPRMPLARVQKEIQTHTALQPEFLRIDSADRTTIFGAPVLAPYSSAPAAARPRLWTAGIPGQPLRILAVRRTINGTNYGLLLATDLTVPFDVVRRFGLLLLLSWPILMAAAATIGHWTAGRALAPVLAITTAARNIDASDLSRRIDLPQSRDELRYLAETLNGMLARIESAFRKTIEFTANASHELRTPLAVIRATAEVALIRSDADAGGSASDRAALRQILLEAERNTALLADLLRLARADSGTASLRVKLVNGAEILRATCHECHPLAAIRGIQLRCSPHGPAAWVSADEAGLRSLFRIVLDNALKYTPPGGLVDAEIAADLPGEFVCRIRDTGIGISETDLPHIFERFYRSDRVRNREEGGAGLGLAIAEWMAHAHGGRIEVESELGAGSTFRIVLPSRPGPETAPDPAFQRVSLQGRQG